MEFVSESGHPLPIARGSPFSQALQALPVAVGMPSDRSVLMRGVSRRAATNVPYLAKKLGYRFRTKSTNQGLRVWRVA